MLSKRLALVFAALLLGTNACGAAPDDESVDVDEGQAPLTANDQAMIDLAGKATKTLYANVDGRAPKELAAALIAAAKRGVDAHVIVTVNSHDTTWLLQQRLEASGLDVDVRTASPVKGVLLIADGTALVPTTSGTKTVKTVKTVTSFITKFNAVFTSVHPKPGALLGSGVAIFPMPDSAHDRIVQVLDAAKTSIDLEIYQLQERTVVQALKDAEGRGVRVRVMLEPKTVGSQNFDAVFAELKAAHVDVKKTPATYDTNHNVDHAKFCVVDGKELLFGTGNWVRSGLGGVTEGPYGNRDFWVEDVRTASVKKAQALFDADYSEKSSASIDFGDTVVTPDNADESITGLVDGAKKRLFVYNQSLDDADLVSRLVAAKKRGVDVRVLLGYQPSFGAPSKTANSLKALQAAGIQASFLKSHYLHGKSIVSDDRVYVGSQNFTNGGLRTNREFGEILDDPAVVKTVATTFAADMANPG
jgi:phosphatidylserine/phosphatidylglycerophosphate/cardiolipin synthase-like enzyme